MKDPTKDRPPLGPVPFLLLVIVVVLGVGAAFLAMLVMAGIHRSQGLHVRRGAIRTGGSASLAQEEALANAPRRPSRQAPE